MRDIPAHGPDDGSVEPKRYSVDFAINLSFHLDDLVINFSTHTHTHTRTHTHRQTDRHTHTHIYIYIYIDIYIKAVNRPKVLIMMESSA